MTEKEISINVRLSCQIALLGAITPDIRLITIGWDGLKLLHLRAYFNSEPTPEDWDEMDAVCSEIDADIPFQSDKVECIYSNSSRKDLKLLKHVVYAKKE